MRPILLDEYRPWWRKWGWVRDLAPLLALLAMLALYVLGAWVAGALDSGKLDPQGIDQIWRSYRPGY